MGEKEQEGRACAFWQAWLQGCCVGKKNLGMGDLSCTRGRRRRRKWADLEGGGRRNRRRYHWGQRFFDSNRHSWLVVDWPRKGGSCTMLMSGDSLYYTSTARNTPFLPIESYARLCFQGQMLRYIQKLTLTYHKYTPLLITFSTSQVAGSLPLPSKLLALNCKIAKSNERLTLKGSYCSFECAS